MPGGDGMLELKDVRVQQGTFSLTADFAVDRGARLALIGPSGSGKSTLLSAIAGFLPLSRGDVLWEGQSLAEVAPGNRPVSMLFQDNNLFPHLSVAQNVGLGIRPNLRLDAEERTRVSDSLARVGLEGMDTRRPASLSGGQQSRAALARVLVQNRPLVLLDEPFSALGPALRGEMLELVSELMDDIGGTLVMVTHDPRDAERIAPLMSIVSDGRAAAPEPTETLLKEPPPSLQNYLGTR